MNIHIKNLQTSGLALVLLFTHLVIAANPSLYEPAALETENIHYREQNWNEEDRSRFNFSAIRRISLAVPEWPSEQY